MANEFLFQSRNARNLIAKAIKMRTRRRVGKKGVVRSDRYLLYDVFRSKKQNPAAFDKVAGFCLFIPFL